MIALYDLRVRPATFDFVNWLVFSRQYGASAVVIRAFDASTRKFTIDEIHRRVENILLPCCSLARLPARVHIFGEVPFNEHDPWPDAHLHTAIAGLRYERLETVYPPADAPFTVTIRQTFHAGWRNTPDIPVWKEFALRIGARVIEDDWIRPSPMFERVALYAGAKMNYGVVNGPMSLCSMTPYPCTIFADPETALKGMGQHGVALGENYKHVLPGQRLVWKRPTLDDLLAEHKAMGF